MKSFTPSSKLVPVTIGMGANAVFALDPLVDEVESPVVWMVSKDVSYTASTVPVWEAASWLGASKEFAVGEGYLNLDGSLGLLTDDFQLDSSWNLEPKAALMWSHGRLSLEAGGWGAWNDQGWTDEGANSGLTWSLTDPGQTGAHWKTGVHGWTSEFSGSALGLELGRRSTGERWSTGIALTARRLWDVEVTAQRPGSLRQMASTTNIGDQWQALVQTSLDRNWQDISAGMGLDLDLRASDAITTTSRGSMGKGKSSRTSANYQYTANLDPYADFSWTHGTWGMHITTGWSTDIQQTKGAIEPTSSLWTSVKASKSW